MQCSGQRQQRLRAQRLACQRDQLVEHGALRIGADAAQVADAFRQHQAGIGQRVQLALQRRAGKSGARLDERLVFG